MLFDDVRAPANDPADHEQRRVEFDEQTHVVIESCAGPIEIWRNLFYVPHASLDYLRDLLHLLIAGLGGELKADWFQIAGSGITIFVNAMSESHDSSFPGQRVADP